MPGCIYQLSSFVHAADLAPLLAHPSPRSRAMYRRRMEAVSVWCTGSGGLTAPDPAAIPAATFPVPLPLPLAATATAVATAAAPAAAAAAAPCCRADDGLPKPLWWASREMCAAESRGKDLEPMAW